VGQEALEDLLGDEVARDLILKLDVEPFEQAANLDPSGRVGWQKATAVEGGSAVSSRYSAITLAPGTAISPSIRTGVAPDGLRARKLACRSQGRSSIVPVWRPISARLKRTNRECGQKAY
jgi:hypothetical protein